MSKHVTRIPLRVRLQARRKAVVGGVWAFLTFAVTAVLLAPELRDTVTGWLPDWLRPVAPVLFVVGAAWAVERTRNRTEGE